MLPEPATGGSKTRNPGFGTPHAESATGADQARSPGKRCSPWGQPLCRPAASRRELRAAEAAASGRAWAIWSSCAGEPRRSSNRPREEPRPGRQRRAGGRHASVPNVP
jgi:hypothetical protein